MGHDTDTSLKAIIFDWDYTLVTRAGRRLITQSDDLRHRLSLSTSPAIDQQSTIVTASPLTSAKRVLDSAYRFFSPPKLIDPETPTLLEELLGQDIPVIILSTGEQDKLEREVTRIFGPARACKLHIHGEAIGKPRKPNPDVILQPLAEVGVEPSNQVVMIGDRFHRDMKAAIGAGIQPILVRSGVPSEAQSAQAYNETHGNVIKLVDDLHGARRWLNEHHNLQLSISDTPIAAPAIRESAFSRT